VATIRKDFYINTGEIQLLANALKRIPSHMPNILEKSIYEEANVIFKESQKLVPVDTGALSILTGANGNITVSPNGTGVVIMTANTIPSANATYDLGSTTARWKTVFTSDLDLNNGIGDWTIVEGEDDLFLYNNKKGKVFKFALIEVDSATATPKIDRLK
jgi:hypothetical protein